MGYDNPGHWTDELPEDVRGALRDICNEEFAVAASYYGVKADRKG